MKIVQACKYTAPAKDSMGTQRLVECLSRGLEELGHEVCYLINNDSKIDGNIIKKIPNDVDVVHFHGDFPKHFGYGDNEFPWVYTCHGGGTNTRDTFPDIDLYEEKIVCVSKFVMDKLGLFRYVHNGVDQDVLKFSDKKENYFLWIGGTDWGMEKGLFYAISLAKKLKFNLKIAGNGKNAGIIETLKGFRERNIQYIGSVNGEKKAEILSKAKGVFMIGDILDACPLVTLEALMSGTPVIAKNIAVHPEVINKEVGFLCDTEKDIVKAVMSIDKINPETCRTYALDNFSKEVLAKNYIKVYDTIMRKNTLNLRGKR